MQIEKKFIHLEERNKTKAPEEIVPLIFELLNPQSIIDIGCGTGNFLKVFKQYGVKEVLGVDGSWVNKKLLEENLSEAEFFEKDLEKLKFIDINKKFELVLCLEVAEHLSPGSADNLIKNLVNFGDNILFSAAVPFQGGQNHLNEQWIQYWQEKFSKYNFYFHDVLRPRIWNNINVPYWFQQNLFFITNSKHFPVIEEKTKSGSALNYVHPELYLSKAIVLNKILTGSYPLTGYLKLLCKAFLVKMRILKY